MSHSYDYTPDKNAELECDRCGESLWLYSDYEMEQCQLGNGEHFGCYMEAQD